MAKKKIAINGFGRIGRLTFRQIFDNHPNLEIVAINDLTDLITLNHLLKYDSVYGIYDKEISRLGDDMLVDGKAIKIFAQKDPAVLPWKNLGVDIVLECTGVFSDFEKAQKHIQAGAKEVIISAPSKDPEKIPSFILGVNADKFDSKYKIVDMASCTTNCLAPVAKVINDNFKIISGFMTTCHAYTNDQRILDLPHKDLRRARAAALNIIPTSTGAAKALGKVIPELAGKLDGIAFRVPVPNVSVVDLICQVEKQTSVQDVNEALKKASQSEMKGILALEEAPLVSSDFRSNLHSAIVDSALTMVKDQMVKVVAWYDNEMGYSSRLAEFAEYVGKKI